MRAIVLAGGLGTRLRSVVPDVPKPMAPVSGRPFLELLLDYWLDQGVTEVVLAVGYMNQKIREHFGNSYRGVPVRWSIEKAPLGTGGALLAAWSAIGGERPVLVLNGDTFLEARLDALERTLRAKDAEGVIAVFKAPLDARYAVIVTAGDRRVTRIGAPGSAERGYMNGGAYLLTPSFFAQSFGPEASSLESDLLPASLAAEKKLYACPVAGRFIDIGVPEDYLRAPEVLGPRTGR